MTKRHCLYAANTWQHCRNHNLGTNEKYENTVRWVDLDININNDKNGSLGCGFTYWPTVVDGCTRFDHIAKPLIPSLIFGFEIEYFQIPWNPLTSVKRVVTWIVTNLLFLFVSEQVKDNFCFRLEVTSGGNVLGWEPGGPHTYQLVPILVFLYPKGGDLSEPTRSLLMTKLHLKARARGCCYHINESELSGTFASSILLDS